MFIRIDNLALNSYTLINVIDDITKKVSELPNSRMTEYAKARRKQEQISSGINHVIIFFINNVHRETMFYALENT